MIDHTTATTTPVEPPGTTANLQGHAASAPLARQCETVALLLGLGVLVAAAAVALTAITSGHDAMWGSVLGLGTMGAALVLQTRSTRSSQRQRWIARVLAMIVGLHALACLCNAFLLHATWLDAQQGPVGMIGHVAIMHPMTSLSLLLGACALLLQDVRLSRDYAPAEFLALTLIVMNAVPLAGRLFNIDATTASDIPAGMPWMLTVALLGIGFAELLAQPSRQLMRTITDQSPGALMLRRTLPLSLLLLITLNVVLWRGTSYGWFLPGWAPPLQTLASAGMLILILWLHAARMNREIPVQTPSAATTADAGLLLRAVSDHTADPIFVKDCEGKLLFANPAALRLIGKTRDEAMQRSSSELFSDSREADQIDCDDQRILHNRVSETVEQTLHLPDGVRTYSSTKAPWIDDHGNVRGIIGISTDISAYKQIESELRQRGDEVDHQVFARTASLRELADQLETVREEEKRAVARELHDDVGTSLTSLSMHLDTIYKVLPDDPKWIERSAQVQALVTALVSTTRRLQTELRPIMLDLFGLKAGVTELCDEFAQQNGIECKISLPDEEVALPRKLEISLYRMLQEALRNVSTHAQATRVEVILDIDEDGAALIVRDDGIGIAADRLDSTDSFGLRLIRERATYLGGSVRVFANSVNGTTVRIELPATPDQPIT